MARLTHDGPESTEPRAVYKPGEFAGMLGVSVSTLQRWDREGILKARRLPSNRRYYTDAELDMARSGQKS